MKRPLGLGLACLLLLVACGDDGGGDPHALGACVGWTDNQGNPITGQCEAACEAPPTSSGNTCDTTVQLNCRAFTFSGTEGCCIAQGTVIRFFECQ